MLWLPSPLRLGATWERDWRKGASSRVGLPHLFKGSPKVVAIPPADRNCCHAYSGLLGTRRL